MRRQVSSLNLDGAAAAANGMPKIRSLVCKRPALEENPSNSLANGMNLSSRQFHHAEVSRRHNDVVFAMDEMLRGYRVGDAMEVSTFRTHPRDVRSVQDAGWRAGAPAEVTLKN
jgi:hypothetical protein